MKTKCFIFYYYNIQNTNPQLDYNRKHPILSTLDFEEKPDTKSYYNVMYYYCVIQTEINNMNFLKLQ